MAGEQGRDVYAVPGHPMDPRAQGPNKLIQDGAVLIQKAQDILQSMENYTGGNALSDNQTTTSLEPLVQHSKLDDQQSEDLMRNLLQNLSQMPSGVDELARACHVSIPQLQMALLELELAGRLQRLPGNRVVLIN